MQVEVGMQQQGVGATNECPVGELNGGVKKMKKSREWNDNDDDGSVWMLPLFCVWTYISQVENNKMLRKTEEARARGGRTGFVLDRIGFHHFQLKATFLYIAEAERKF